MTSRTAGSYACNEAPFFAEDDWDRWRNVSAFIRDCACMVLPVRKGRIVLCLLRENCSLSLCLFVDPLQKSCSGCRMARARLLPHLCQYSNTVLCLFVSLLISTPEEKLFRMQDDRNTIIVPPATPVTLFSVSLPRCWSHAKKLFRMQNDRKTILREAECQQHCSLSLCWFIKTPEEKLYRMQDDRNTIFVLSMLVVLKVREPHDSYEYMLREGGLI
jgi:hypothetical protein